MWTGIDGSGMERKAGEQMSNGVSLVFEKKRELESDIVNVFSC